MLIPLGILASAGASRALSWSSVTLPFSPGQGAAALYASLANASWFAFGNGGSNTTDYAYSTSGASWTLGTLPASKLWGAAATNNSRVIVFEKNAADTVIATSTNGTTWTTASITSITAQQAIYDGTYFLVTNSGSTSANLYYSTDGISAWTAVDAGPALHGIGYDGTSRHIATANASASTARTTTTGVTVAGNWSDVTLPANAVWRKPIFGNGYWIMRDTNGNGAYSTNGTTWTSVSWGYDLNAYIFAYGDFYGFDGPFSSGTFRIQKGANPTVMTEIFSAASSNEIGDAAAGDNKILAINVNGTNSWLGV